MRDLPDFLSCAMEVYIFCRNVRSLDTQDVEHKQKYQTFRLQMSRLGYHKGDYVTIRRTFFFINIILVLFYYLITSYSHLHFKISLS